MKKLCIIDGESPEVAARAFPKLQNRTGEPYDRTVRFARHLQRSTIPTVPPADLSEKRESILVSTIGNGLAGAFKESLRGAQRVAVVLEPGPLGSHLGRWEAVRMAAAEKEVQEAVERFFRPRSTEKNDSEDPSPS
ncbi:hypothetical protein VOLCADRAFT_97855 [Volvox carteri f. nagariensis]|uniref:Uncharacterized protein n=1 Tax=Volvox carteri f. nagariensis TaxID=3068 RepID=D8UDT9_VOLCA|nr:uncharacterized protein VOLCADRAFT_97855 [Volvox carteri f. nagariensis]EFJ42151.1 hypothetical protein VOLCADRAFT_97855 [Volvox carteri f. nagariensis]|eukprot:XP_002956848.1 hypothetical protein VOLCADRAFT_97855 [Volvox carteri f. nagariensis]